jgi:hypothetical protein
VTAAGKYCTARSNDEADLSPHLAFPRDREAINSWPDARVLYRVGLRAKGPRDVGAESMPCSTMGGRSVTWSCNRGTAVGPAIASLRPSSSGGRGVLASAESAHCLATALFGDRLAHDRRQPTPLPTIERWVDVIAVPPGHRDHIPALRSWIWTRVEVKTELCIKLGALAGDRRVRRAAERKPRPGRPARLGCFGRLMAGPPACRSSVAIWRERPPGRCPVEDYHR